MNTLYFKYAVEVEQTRSITQAAENLFMAQPNLSKAIKELEDSLGIIIFERNSKGVTPTKKGMEFLEYAKNILVQLNKMEGLLILFLDWIIKKKLISILKRQIRWRQFPEFAKTHFLLELSAIREVTKLIFWTIFRKKIYVMI